MPERNVRLRVGICELGVLGVLWESVWSGVRGGVHREGALLWARAVRWGLGGVHLLRRVGRGELLGGDRRP